MGFSGTSRIYSHVQKSTLRGHQWFPDSMEIFYVNMLEFNITEKKKEKKI